MRNEREMKWAWAGERCVPVVFISMAGSVPMPMSRTADTEDALPTLRWEKNEKQMCE